MNTLDYNLDFSSKDKLLSSIKTFAEKLALKSILHINESYYQLTEFEFYIHSRSDLMKDHYTYGHELQKRTGYIFDHASGIDLTFGKDGNAAGVLIRGIAKLNGDDITAFINGPHNVRTELIGNLKFNASNLIALEAINEQEAIRKEKTYRLIATRRFGLNKKAAEDTESIALKDNFYEKELRYICLIPRFHRVTNKNSKVTFLKKYSVDSKQNGIEKILTEAIIKKLITKDFALTVLGYCAKEWNAITD